eukprot:TRINITY_DN10692_c0_g1_i2.p1 TRINITY_DN10692_c0_g1~~TRINITY_DN10692_c0_g1_i2.p1  ORF type:complete len:473 (-),score=60.30 TRINITY_DN10692_c0_g1_i2:313-1731(-)
MCIRDSINAEYMGALKYLLIMGSLVLISASIFFFIFKNESSSYKTYYQSMLTLISASQSLFDLTQIHTHQSWVMVTYLFLINVIMLNIVIAVIVVNFKNLQKKAKIEYAITVYADYQDKKYSKLYNAMLAYPPPINIINMVLIPILLIFKCQKINKLFQLIAYTIFIFPLFFIIFVAVNCFIFIPLAYLRMFVTVQGIERKLFKTHKNSFNLIFRTAYNNFLWLIGGLFWHFIVFLSKDLPQYVKSCYSYQNMKQECNKKNIYKFYLFYPFFRWDKSEDQNNQSFLYQLAYNIQQKQELKFADKSQINSSQQPQQIIEFQKKKEYSQLGSPKLQAQYEFTSEQTSFIQQQQEESQKQLDKKIQILKKMFSQNILSSSNRVINMVLSVLMKQVFISLNFLDISQIRGHNIIRLYYLITNKRVSKENQIIEERVSNCLDKELIQLSDTKSFNKTQAVDTTKDQNKILFSNKKQQ